ncbi:reticulocyte-binding protein 2 homolog a-like isoform X2 [Limulus polyphemus]|uniref:Reticulocyte-binding protein 2 homolog a-like isoform X2 n=1 Tax=Limulus polyphemus TaxID=6850 RepID=A0ABM1SJF3_LIMPO|nr:reticulocyte-binding protein 2 homolog a-like isoform X2 [Limulus polyphemus]
MDTERSKTLLPCQENSLSQAEWDIVQLVSDMECERNQQESIPCEEPEAEKDSDDSVLSVEQVKSLLQEALHHHLGGEKDVKLDDLLEILHQQLVTDHVNKPEDFDSPKETITTDLPHAQPPETAQVDNGFEDLEHLVLQEASNNGMFEPNDDFVVGMASEILHDVGNELEPEEIGKVMIDHSYSMLATDFTKHFWKSDHMETQGEGEEEDLDNDSITEKTSHKKSKRSTPLRRSQRQIDKIDRALVEKIRAENAELQRQEKEEMEKQKALAEQARMDCDDISDSKNINISVIPVNSQASDIEPVDSRHSSGKKGKTANQAKESKKKVTSIPNKGKNSKGKNSSYKMIHTFEEEENVQKLNKKSKNENKIHSSSRKKICSKNNTVLQSKINSTSRVSRKKISAKDSSFAPKKKGRPMKNISKTNKNIVAKNKLRQRILLAGKKLHKARSYTELNTEFDHFKYKQNKSSSKDSHSEVKKMPQQIKIKQRKRLKFKSSNGHFKKKLLDSRDDWRKSESLSCSNSQCTESSEDVQSQEPKKIKLQKQMKTVSERKNDNIKKGEELRNTCDNKQSLSVHSFHQKEQICNNSKRVEVCLASKQGNGSKNGYSVKNSVKMQTDESEQKKIENLANCHIQVLLEKIDVTLASNKRLHTEVSREQEFQKDKETYFKDKHQKGEKLAIHKFKKFKKHKEIINDQKEGEDPENLGKKKKTTKDNVCKLEEQEEKQLKVKKEEQSSSKNEQKTEEKEDSINLDFNQLRLNVRRALKDVLTSRLKNADDILLTSDELKSITLHIEKELYKLHKENIVKYRNVYCVLIINFKDPKNKILFRKVLKGIIPPDRLVRMSPQDLSFKDDRKRSQQLESPKKQIDQGSLFLQSFGMLIDTTDQHHSHLFDLKCQICTGKIPPPKEESPNKKKILIGMEDRTNSNIKYLAKTTAEPLQEKCSAVTGQSQNTSLKNLGKDTCLTDSEYVNKIMLDSNEAVVNSVKTESVTSNFPSDKNQEKNLDTVVLNPAVEEKRKIEQRETDNSVYCEMKPVEKTSPTFTTGVILRTMKTITTNNQASGGKDLSNSVPLETSVTEKQTSHLKLSKTPSWGWKGFIFMEEVARFVNFGYIVSGSKDYVSQDMPNTLYVCGRIAPDQVWSYLGKTKPLATKELIVVSFYPANKEEMVSYSAFYHYLFSRKRLGVIGHTSKMVKDFYILPLPADQPIPSVLLPFNGPGLQNPRPNLLLGLIVRHKNPLKKISSTPGTMCWRNTQFLNQHLLKVKPLKVSRLYPPMPQE